MITQQNQIFGGDLIENDYSCLPNSRAGLIKRAGWNSTEKKLSEQGLLSEQGGRF